MWKVYLFTAPGCRAVKVTARTDNEAWNKLQKTHEYYFNRTAAWKITPRKEA